MNGFQPFGGNLWAPPLLFGRRPPQSNCPPDTVHTLVHRRLLEIQYLKSGIPRPTPPRLTSWLLRLPPILYIKYRTPISGCSKALRGLSVQLRVMCIFTHTTISPGHLLRQYRSRYAIRAGRYLSVKEFRYLRTVIVTAAVYRGFSSVLRLP